MDAQSLTHIVIPSVSFRQHSFRRSWTFSNLTPEAVSPSSRLPCFNSLERLSQLQHLPTIVAMHLPGNSHAAGIHGQVLHCLATDILTCVRSTSHDLKWKTPLSCSRYCSHPWHHPLFMSADVLVRHEDYAINSLLTTSFLASPTTSPHPVSNPGAS